MNKKRQINQEEPSNEISEENAKRFRQDRNSVSLFLFNSFHLINFYIHPGRNPFRNEE